MAKVSGGQARHKTPISVSRICAVCCLSRVRYVYLQRAVVSTVKSRCLLSVTGLTERHPEQSVSQEGGREGGLRRSGKQEGGQLVLLHIRFCLFFISGFRKKKTI